MAISSEDAFGIDDPESVMIEKVPISFKSPTTEIKLQRIYD